MARFWENSNQLWNLFVTLHQLGFKPVWLCVFGPVKTRFQVLPSNKELLWQTPELEEGDLAPDEAQRQELATAKELYLSASRRFLRAEASKGAPKQYRKATYWYMRGLDRVLQQVTGQGLEQAQEPPSTASSSSCGGALCHVEWTNHCTMLILLVRYL